MKRPWPALVDVADPEVRARWTRLGLETVIDRVRPGNLAAPLLLTGYLALVWGDRRSVVTTLAALAIQVALATVRGILYRSSAAARAADPDRWRRVFATLAAAVLFTWEAFAVLEVWHRNFDVPTLFVIMTALLLRSAGTYATAPDLYFHARWSRWSRIPAIVAALALLPVRDGLILGLAFVGQLVYAEALCRRLNAELWRRIAATDALARAEVELRLAQKLESVGRLAAGIAHEINTPLQAIANQLAFLGDVLPDVITASADPDLAAQLPRACADASASVERAAAIVRSLRAFTHPDEAVKTPVDINGLLATALTMARHECQVAEIVTDFGELPGVEGYAGELGLAFLNLIVNAAHAIEATRAPGVLRVTTRREGDAVRISIADTGIGIPDAIKDQIFDPFFTTKDVGKGTGQGLTIAHAVITRRHGGEVSFTSAVGRGTTFTVVLPVHAVRAAA